MCNDKACPCLGDWTYHIPQTSLSDVPTNSCFILEGPDEKAIFWRILDNENDDYIPAVEVRTARLVYLSPDKQVKPIRDRIGFKQC